MANSRPRSAKSRPNLGYAIPWALRSGAFTRPTSRLSHRRHSESLGPRLYPARSSAFFCLCALPASATPGWGPPTGIALAALVALRFASGRYFHGAFCRQVTTAGSVLPQTLRPGIATGNTCNRSCSLLVLRSSPMGSTPSTGPGHLRFAL